MSLRCLARPIPTQLADSTRSRPTRLRSVTDTQFGAMWAVTNQAQQSSTPRLTQHSPRYKWCLIKG